MQGIFFFLPFCLQNNNKRRKKTIVIYSAYIYIKAFLMGRLLMWYKPPLLHNQINSLIYHDTLQCYIIFMLPAVNEQIHL